MTSKYRLVHGLNLRLTTDGKMFLLEDTILDSSEIKDCVDSFVKEVFNQHTILSKNLMVFSFYDPVRKAWLKNRMHEVYINVKRDCIKKAKKAVEKTQKEMSEKQLTINDFINWDIKTTNGLNTLCFRINYNSKNEHSIYRLLIKNVKNNWDLSWCKVTEFGDEFDFKDYQHVTDCFIKKFLPKAPDHYGYVFLLTRGEKLYGVSFLYSSEYISKPKLEAMAHDFDVVFRIYLYHYLSDAMEMAVTQACKAAAAAIMSRNMSHHIGSHVIPRTTLDALKKRLVEFFFNERGPDTLKEYHMLYEMTRDLKDPLDDYIRRKAEFIAEATTEPLLSTRSAKFFQEIVFPFIRNTALMDTLAANEGFRYSSFDSTSLVMRCFKKEGEEMCEFIPRLQHPVYGNEVKTGSGTLPCIPYAGRSASDRGTALVSFIEEEDQDVRVALPGPVGEMAFYGILENIIRNAAKHSGVQKDRDNTKNLEVHIVICDPTEESDHYAVEIYENLTIPNQKFKWKQDGQNKTGTLKKMVQHYIEASIIDDQGKLREKAWGIAEMAISASLLKGCLDLKSTSLQVKAGPPVQKFSTTAIGHSECLIYTIRMMKARTALLIGFNDSQNRKELERKGFSFVKKPDEFLESKGSAEKASTSFQFAVILADALQKEGECQYPLDKIRHRLPFRIIIAGTNDTYERFSKYPCDALTYETPPMDDGADALSKWLWKTWLRRWKIENETNDPCCYGIDLYLGQESNVEPTRSWIEKANEFNEECEKTHRSYGMRIWGKESVKRFTDWKKPPLNHRLVLDRHGLFAQYSNELLRLRDEGCYVVIDKSNADFDAVFNPSFSKPFVLPYELLEAGLLRILVLDERIAQKAMDSLGGTEGIREGVALTLLGRDDFSPTLWHLAARANVFVATHLDILGASTKRGDASPKLELAKNEYRKRSNAFLKKIRDKRRSSACISCPSLKLTVDITKNKDDINIAIERVGPDFSDSKLSCPITDMDAVIVHQGILDWIKQQGKCEKEFLERLQKKIPWLIIESGRGIPPEFRGSRYKFLPFSIVERAFHGERVAKLGLTRALMELTRSR